MTRLTLTPSQRLLWQQNGPRSNCGATRTKAKGADGVEAKNDEGCWRSGSKSGVTDGYCHWFGQVWERMSKVWERGRKSWVWKTVGCDIFVKYFILVFLVKYFTSFYIQGFRFFFFPNNLTLLTILLVYRRILGGFGLFFVIPTPIHASFLDPDQRKSKSWGLERIGCRERHWCRSDPNQRRLGFRFGENREREKLMIFQVWSMEGNEIERQRKRFWSKERRSHHWRWWLRWASLADLVQIQIREG